MTPRFAVTAQEDDGPNAVFDNREDAHTWATLRYGPGNFRVHEVYTRTLPVAAGAVPSPG
jgi:hypothetical protein